MANEQRCTRRRSRGKPEDFYLKADVDTRLLFTAQPAVHAASMNAGVAFWL